MANMRRRRCSLIFVLNGPGCCGIVGTEGTVGTGCCARLVVPALVSLLLPVQVHVAHTPGEKHRQRGNQGVATHFCIKIHPLQI